MYVHIYVYIYIYIYKCHLDLCDLRVHARRLDGHRALVGGRNIS